MWDHIYLFILSFFTLFLKNWLLWVSLETKSKLNFIVLNRTTINKPNENSKPAKANKKKDTEYKFISSFILPYKRVNMYKRIHIISEYNNSVNKLLEFKKKIKKINQKVQFQKTNQISINFYL